jgi:hypothetical protein
MTRTGTPKTTFQATLCVEIEQVNGPEIADPKHVVAWTCADGAWLEGDRIAFRFEVCPTHADPEECDCPDTADVSIFRAIVSSAELDD